MTEGIDLGGACCIARDFLRFMFGNLYVHSFSMIYAGKGKDKENPDDYFIICEIKIPYNNKETKYQFLISPEGIVKKMELRKDA